tara:strand:+ start:351 stop:929 length:579 start_codon:yes stop_codon:yes gene_type:complete
MSAIEEERDLIYALRALQVLLGSGVGLEGAIHHIAQGGYGKFTDDCNSVIANMARGRKLEEEIQRLITSSKSDRYRRLLNSMRTNVTSNTDLLASLEQQADREEEARTDKLKQYVESLQGLPETALSVGFLVPLILGIGAMAPFLMGDLQGVPGVSIPPPDTMLRAFQAGMALAIAVMGMMIWGAKNKDPGV